MKVSNLILIGCVVGAGLAHAGVAKFTGQGHLSKQAEYVEVNVDIVAQCYWDIAEAREKANDAAKKAMDLFRTMIDPNNPAEAVYANGGRTKRLTGSHQAVNCRGAFEKTVRVTLITADLESFEQNFAVIEQLVYQDLSQPSSGSAQFTFATLAVPVAHLFSATIEELNKQALKLALQNAKEKFELLREAGCGVGSFAIVTFEEPHPGANIPNPYAGTRSVPPSAPSSGGSVVFKDIWVTKALDVTFEYEGGRCEALSN